jgi:type I restriction enzyme, S subunit
MSKFSEVMLSDLAAQERRAIISGPFGSDIGTEFFQPSGVPVIRGNNLTTDFRKFVDQGFVFVTAEKADTLNAYAQRKDIVLTAAGTIGQVGIIPEDSLHEKYVISNKQLRIRIDPSKANPYYVYYWLASPWILKTIIGRNTGSTVPLINLGTLRGIPVRIPKERSTQDRIANFISTIDDKIALNHRINAELEAMAKLLYDYWYVQFDFPISAAQAATLGKPGLEGQPYRSSGGKMTHHPDLKREIPVGWKAGHVSELCFLNHRTWGNKDHPNTVTYLDLANAKDGEILGVQHFEWDDAPSRARRILTPGDTLIGTVRPGNRSFAMVPESDGVLTGSTGFAVLSPKSKAYREFNYLSLTSEANIKRLTTVASGAAYPAVNPEVVAAHHIAIPAPALVERFHATVAPSFELIEQHAKQNQELAALRDWLLPMLMNGQVTVG